MTATPDTEWHLDKRFPIALILTIFLQSAAAIWWAATIDAEVEKIGEYVASDRSKISSLEDKVEAGARADAVITQQLRTTADNIHRLSTEVERTNALLRELLRAGSANP